MATICILLPSHWNALKGGAEYQADSLARYLTENTIHRVVYVARNVANHSGGEGYRVESIGSGRPPQKYGLFLDAPALYRTLTRLAPDLVVQHGGCAYTGIAAWYCKNHGRPLIWYLASDRDAREIRRPLSLKYLPAWIDQQLLHYGIRHAGTIVAQTHVQVNELQKNYRRDAHHVIPNFHPPCTQRLQKGADVTVLWIGNLKRLKRPELFLRVAKACGDQAKLRFRMIGRRERSRWCDDLLQEVNRLPNTAYLGELSLEEVNRHLAEAHLLVNTSEYEGFPNTFIQAWLREVPVVSLNVDPDGVISQRNLGFLADSVERMGAWLLGMAEERKQLAQIGVRARRFAEDHYSMGNAQRLTDLIDALLMPEPAGRLWGQW